MKKSRPDPLDSPRDFRVDEMFFSTTDRRGIILSGNEVFIRISGYPAPEMIGQPHNFIRHPDMPRTIFRLVWNYLKLGQAVAGYVKNLAADGRYYWVVAIFSPLQDGFLSIRFKPSSELHAVVESLYGELGRLERDSGSAGMDVAEKRLLAVLVELGFTDYDAFMAAMLHSELKSRDVTIASRRAKLLPAQIATVGTRGAAQLQAIYERYQDTYRQINRLYDELDEFARLQRELHTGFAGISNLTHEFRIVALNVTIKSAQLGESGRCIGVISAYLVELSARIFSISSKLAARIRPVGAGLQSVIFNLAAARLKLEMIMLFCHELATAGPRHGVDRRNVYELQASFDATIRAAVQGLLTAETALRGFGSHAEEFRRLTLTMQVVQLGGAVEASRLLDDGSLAQTFRDVRGQTEASKSKLDALADVIAAFDQLASAAPAITKKITEANEHTRIDLQEFLALLDQPPALGPAATVSVPASAAANSLPAIQTE